MKSLAYSYRITSRHRARYRPNPYSHTKGRITTWRPADVYLVIRQTDERTGEQTIRWMNVTRYLKNRRDKESRQILFDGEPLTMEAVWKLRDAFFPPQRAQKR